MASRDDMQYGSPVFDIDETERRFRTDDKGVNLMPDSEDMHAVWAKTILMYQYYARHWRPLIVVGQKCQDYMRRKIFTDSQRDYYENVLHKIVVEPQEMKPVIDALMGIVRDRVQEGAVTTEDDTPPKGAAAPEAVAVVLKWMRQQLKLTRKEEDVLRDGLTTGFPMCLWYDRKPLVEQIGWELTADIRNYDSTLPTPWFESPDGSDIEDVILIDPNVRTRTLLDLWPKRAEAFKALGEWERSSDMYNSLMQRNETLTADDRASWLTELVKSAALDRKMGFETVITRQFAVREKQHIYYDPDADTPILLPHEWNGRQIELWRRSNPTFSVEYDRFVKTLHTHVVSTDGMIWYAGADWYQNFGALRCNFFIADMVNRMPTGKGPDMIPDIFTIAAAATEGLDDVRKGTGNVTFYNEGMMRHPSRVGAELTLPNGSIPMKPDSDVRRDVAMVQRKPNETYMLYEDRVRGRLREAHGITGALIGRFGGRQSVRAKEMEIDQGLLPQSAFILNFSHFRLDVGTKLCSFFPYVLNGPRIVRIKDEFGENAEVAVNQEQIDPMSGQANIIANDLVSIRYRVTAVPGDTSKTSRETQLREFFEFLEATGNTLFRLFEIAPTFMAQLLKSFPNIYTRQIGTSLMQSAEQQAQAAGQEADAERQEHMMDLAVRQKIETLKAQTPRVMLRTTAQDIQQYPEGMRIFMHWLTGMQESALQNAASGALENKPRAPQMQLPGPAGGPGGVPGTPGEPAAPGGQPQPGMAVESGTPVEFVGT